MTIHHSPNISVHTNTHHTIRSLRITSKNYPPQLAQIADPPEMLYLRGRAEILAAPAIAVVGCRAMTPYGKSACQKIVRQLVQAGVVIVSGLAMGIDSIAHETALEYDGTTVAVLGSGLDPDHIFPPTKHGLAHRIVASGGALISEYPSGMPAQKHHFPARNRIIAGLSAATIVVEAAKKSGALITARLALQYNREVGAVPGSIFHSRSVGTNRLIRQGAHIITSAEDIIQELPAEIQHSLAGVHSQHYPAIVAGDSQKILDYIDQGVADANQLVQNMKISAAELTVNLTNLEINGIVRKNSDSTYTRIQ